MTGYKSYLSGLNFEQMVEDTLKRENISYLRLPKTGGDVRVINRKKVFVGKKICFDFITSVGHKGICFDTKSTKKDRMSRSYFFHEDRVHQLKSMLELSLPCGFVVFFVYLNKVIYFHKDLINNLKPNSSLKPEEGHYLGNSDLFSIKEVFKLERCLWS